MFLLSHSLPEAPHCAAGQLLRGSNCTLSYKSTYLLEGDKIDGL